MKLAVSKIENPGFGKLNLEATTRKAGAFASAFFVCWIWALSCYGQIRLLQSQTNASFRGLSVVDDSVAWVSGSQGTVLRTVNGGKTWKHIWVPGFEKADFRTLYAFDSLNALVGNAGSPAVLLRTADGGKTWTEVYRNAHPDAFLDGVDFWNGKQGMVYGDPINQHLLMLRTSDAGRTWLELPENERPKLDSGEASFAASGTNIRTWDKSKVLIATGGKISRLWFSANRGKNWKAIPVPMLQGKSSQGVFSVAVHKKTWVLVGGDYLADTLRERHVWVSEDEGKSWRFPESPTGGYRECVELISENEWLATGPTGTERSLDAGKTWTPVSDERGFHVLRKARRGSLILFAGGKGKLARFDKN